MEELSKSLDVSFKEQSPEDYIRKTLRAHGFFNHFEPKEPAQTKKALALHGISEEDKKRTTQLISHFREGREFHTLKEPRHLYGYTQNNSLLQQDSGGHRLPFWPTEVDCIRERPKHLLIPPKFREPYYNPDQEVVSPKIRSAEGSGRTVYLNLPGPQKFYVKSRCGPSLNLPPVDMALPAVDTTLQFESRFESGNLGKVVQVGRWDYELYLRHDLYTKKYTQWFYFRVRNMQAGQTYRFTVVNLYKAGSLYNEGMQPVFYSEKEARDRKLGWHRTGHNIKYFKTPIKRQDTKQESFCYGVTWSHTFTHTGDTCFFAHSFPYTYSDLQDYLKKLLTNRKTATFCKYRVLCRTIAGNPVPLLTITSPSLTPDDSLAKRGVVVTARIHPGETNGSWMMKGLLDFLTSSADDAKILRDLFVFKIVPMLNPDGVIVGNYRCSLSGRDLNRNYRSKLKDSYPTVWHTRNMVKQFCQEREVVMFCDLHGHSRKHNVFIYGCDALDDASSRLKSRVFPVMLSKNAPDMFSYHSSRFVVQKSKEGTGRVVMWREAGIQNSYTLEATFAGSTQGKLSGVQFSTAHLEEMGYHLCDTLLDYCDPDQSKTEKIMQELEEDYRRSVLAALAALGQELPPGVDPLEIEIDPALMAEEESSDAGSDSSDSDGPPVHLQWKKHQKTKKKKKLKSRKERNKRKALLKMNHRMLSIPTPSVSQQTTTSKTSAPKRSQSEAKEEKDKKSECNPATTQQSFGAFATSHPSSYNGGIPLFIQERLEERQRKKVEEDSSDPVMEVPADELRQALLQIQATHTQQQAVSSTLFIPHPGCPMNISQVNMCEVVSRRQSRRSSKASLPQLDGGGLVPPELPPLFPSSGNRKPKGGFTSQFVAHHLQHIGTAHGGSLPPESSLINNTRNLSNLSRLFRQLHPSAVTHSSHTTDLHRPQPSEDRRLQEQGNHERESAIKETYMSPSAVADIMATTPRGIAGKVNATERFQVYSQSSQGVSASSTYKMSSEAKTENSHDPTSSSSLSRSSPPSNGSTSSWQSFSQGMTLADRQPADETKREVVQMERDHRRHKEKVVEHRHKRVVTVSERNNIETTKVLLEAELDQGKRREVNLTEHSSKKKAKEHLIKEQTEMQAPPPEQTSKFSPVFTHLPPDQRRTQAISTHKQGIISAMENTHLHPLQKPHVSDYRITTTPHVPKSKSDPLPSSRLLTPLSKDYTTSLQSEPSRTTEPSTQAGRRSVGQGKRVEGTQTDQKWKLEHSDNTKAYYEEMTHVRTNVAPHGSSHPSHTASDQESLLQRVYSSKPPSRYGPRPGPDDGVPPSTVSIMLARRPGSTSIPATIHCSRRRKHSHIHYFTNKTLT